MDRSIEIIPLAMKKLDKRGIAPEVVKDAILNPSEVVQGYGGRTVAHKHLEINEKKFLLRVVYEESENALTVITAYLTTQIDRYSKGEAK